MKLHISLAVLGSLILLALITLIVVIALASSDNGRQNTVVETRYQCYDGRFVSSIDQCPKATVSLTTSIRQLPEKQQVTVSTSTLCPFIDIPSLTTIFTSSTTILKGPSCNKDSDCGSISYGNITCSIGCDEHIIVNTPKCVNVTGAPGMYCLTVVSTELRKECPSGWRCKKGVGCVELEES